MKLSKADLYSREMRLVVEASPGERIDRFLRMCIAFAFDNDVTVEAAHNDRRYIINPEEIVNMLKVLDREPYHVIIEPAPTKER
jgi:hypothetical protein